jgi:hypothetical protein
MPGEILISTAYFPPAEYFSVIKNADAVLIEQEENYVKQTYRNRCKILASDWILSLTVPVMKGAPAKVLIKDILIDYSKRWQQVHIRAITSSYSRSPYFQFYFGQIEKILLSNHKYLMDLNDELLNSCLELLNIKKFVSRTFSFKLASKTDQDFRYNISPKKISGYHCKPYIQVFGQNGFVEGLSILDLIFNMGPEAAEYL